MAAGLGFKTFTTGEVLTAADTNGYLMQGVLVFASSAARAAAITSPQEGQYSYLKDTNSTEYYDGAAWIAAPIGDITGVTAGTGISGGGTSGTVTITNSMATEITAKGDLIVGTGSATFDNLTVGTNGQTLVADSTASTGLKWAAASAGALTLVTSGTFSAVTSKSVDSAFSSTYKNYTLFLNLAADTTVATTTFRYRVSGTDNSSSNYYGGYFGYTSAGTLSKNAANPSTSVPFVSIYPTASTGTTGIKLDLYDPFNNASSNSHPFNYQTYDPGVINNGLYGGGQLFATAAVDGFSLLFSNACSGTYKVYGWNS